VEFTNPDGLFMMGGDLSVERLLDRRIQSRHFPWYDASELILWWSPDPRMVLFPENLKVSKSEETKRSFFQVTYNQDFNGVIRKL
jgi:leucyl/phenylalanyl-tRNA--protein transferase